MTTTTSTTVAKVGASPASRTVVAGVVGGLAGGMVFGMMMQMMGFIPMIAALVGSSSVAVGWVVHLAISAVIGALFGLLLAGRALRLGAYAGAGLVYGVVWWVLGPLVLMPAKLGMPLFQFNDTVWKSLMGHMIYGLVLGLVAGWVVRRNADA
ncbi:MAG: hypothetical protein GC157_16160 [Frankiales bacterium]|nr:hypothetical protein [Frankiales bacterium]